MTQSASTEEARPVSDGPGPTRSSGHGERGHGESHDDPPSAASRGVHIGWVRAIVSGVLIVAVSFAAVVLMPNAVVTGSLLPSRDARGVMAAALAVVMVVLIAIVLRRLQARRLI